MDGQQTPPRKILSPLRPTKIVKKGTTTVPFNRRDAGLTKDQQLWARSLTSSLSGWRTRRLLLKSQLEAHVKIEAERKAQETARKAAVKAEEDELRAKLQAEAALRFARKAAAWEKKAFEMNQAGTESDTEKELDDEQYMYNHDTQSFSPGSFIDPEDEQVINDTDRNAQNDGALNLPTPPTMQPAPSTPNVAVVDWRIKARSGITKKRLTIGKGWSALTWNQKSNVLERLLLLEDDGYDINELQNRKASSEEITAIILERAAAQQRPGNVSPTPMQHCGDSVALLMGGQASSPAALPLTHEQSSPSPAASQNNPPFTQDIPPEKSLPAPSGQHGALQEVQPAMTPMIEEDVQPFCLDKLYQPQVSAPLKRKRDQYIDPTDSEDTVAESHPVAKKRNINIQTEEELRLQALQEIKRRVLRRIFRPARSILRTSRTSNIVFSTNNTRISRDHKLRSISSLDYLYGKQAITTTSDQALHIKLKGYINMIAELHFLNDTSGEADTKMTIADPDEEDGAPAHAIAIESEVVDENPLMPKDREDSRTQRSRIVIFKDEQGRQTFQGDTLTLAELFNALQDQELLHRVDWEWDGLRLKSSNGLLWSLSPETQNSLLELERRLKRAAHIGDVEICVGIDDGRVSP
ncbi:hypothetical protein EJ07DRAFT_159513 [Lizonia empirigonia]|nr:hypothetical protein EJ07DRAFT_159513 [Lizonia empirigonia]